MCKVEHSPKGGISLYSDFAVFLPASELDHFAFAFSELMGVPSFPFP